jgi:hypothetical protein
VLPIFIYLAQKGEQLSENLINKILDTLLNQNFKENLVLKQELLSTLGSLINANREQVIFFKPKIDQILINEIKSNNYNIQKMCIAIIEIMVPITKQLDDKLLQELIHVGINSKKIKSEVYSLFEVFSADKNNNNNCFINVKPCYKEKLQLANLKYNTNSELLNQLDMFVNVENGFLEQNYTQLKNVIDKDANLHVKTLDVLLRSKAKGKMTDELLESLAVLHESSKCEEIRKSCLVLFKESAADGKILQNRPNEVLNSHLNRENNLNKFFQSKVCEELRQDFKISDIIIQDMLNSLNICFKNNTEISNLKDLVQLIVEKNSNSYFDSEPFVFLIEKCLLKIKIIEIALPCYCRIIKEKNTIKLKIV